MRYLVTAALVLALPVSTALAQPRTTALPRTLLVSMLPYLGDETLHKEIKATPEQATQLVEQRGRWFREYTVALVGGDAVKLAEMQKAYEGALAEILKPEQVQRLRQISLQRLDRRQVRAPLSQYAEVVRTLVLNENQLGRLNQGEAMEKVLNVEQKQKWKEMLGPPFAADLVADLGGPAFPDRGTGGSGGRVVSMRTAPLALRLVHELPVQAELKLSEEQITQIKDIEARRAAASRTTGRLNRQPAAQPNKTAENELARVLTAPQARRLQQIVAQVNMHDNGTYAFLRSEPVAVELKWTDEQKQRLEAVHQEHVQALRKVFLSGQPHEQIARQADECQQYADKGLLAVMTNEQKGHFKDLLGEPFQVTLSRTTRSGTGTFGTPARSLLGNLSNLSGQFLGDVGFQKELKLTPEQIQKLQEEPLGTGWAGVPRVLTAEQQTRLRQLNMQQRDHVYGPISLLRIAEVIEALKPTAEQRTQLGTLLSENATLVAPRSLNEGSTLTEVERKAAHTRLAAALTKEQQEQLTRLLGEPFGGKFPSAISLLNRSGGFDGGSTRAPRASLILGYLQAPDVQKDLDLSEEQRARVTKIEEKRLEAFRDYATLSREERTKKSAEVTQMAQKDIDALLTAAQADRLRQIALQQEVHSVGLFDGLVLLKSDVVAALMLTAEQQTRIKNLVQDTDKTRTRLLAEVHNLGRDRAETDTLQSDFNAQAEKRILNILNAQQQEAWARLLGRPFQGDVFGGFGRGPGRQP
jgi:hypothetical protein